MPLGSPLVTGHCKSQNALSRKVSKSNIFLRFETILKFIYNYTVLLPSVVRFSYFTHVQSDIYEGVEGKEIEAFTPLGSFTPDLST